MEEKILKCQNIEEKITEFESRGYEDEGDVLVKNVSSNSAVCIDKETGLVVDITNDGISCEGLAEIVELNNAGLIVSSAEEQEVVEDAKAVAEESGEETN